MLDPFDQDWIQSAPKDALPILVAYDKFDTLAAELRELRAKMERVRESLAQYEQDLRDRKHGDVAAHRCIESVREALK